jgi:hypothetical protein
MRRTMTPTLMLLISAVCLQPATASPSPEKNQKASDLTTLQGCVKIARGQYELIESDGTLHLLSGAARKLGPQVGHEVELSGKPGTRTEDTSVVGAGSSANEFVVFEVKTVKQIADTCQSAAR